MKEFDLEAAKAGKKVMTRDGRNVRIVCFDVKDPVCPILALVQRTKTFPHAGIELRFVEEVVQYSPKGKSGDMNNDLVMATEKKVYYVNIYKDYDARPFYKQLFETYEEAILFALKNDDANSKYITTTKLEWEE